MAWVGEIRPKQFVVIGEALVSAQIDARGRLQLLVDAPRAVPIRKLGRHVQPALLPRDASGRAVLPPGEGHAE